MNDGVVYNKLIMSKEQREREGERDVRGNDDGGSLGPADLGNVKMLSESVQVLVHLLLVGV